MGKPDAIFTMQEDYPIPASGTLDYKFFEIPTNLTEDKWVQAFEVRPGARAVVHHVIVVRAGAGTPEARPSAQAAPARRVRRRRSRSDKGMRRPADAPKPDKAPVENDRAPKRESGRVARRLRAGTIASRLRAGHGDQDPEGRDSDRPDALHDQWQGDDRPHEHRREVRERAAEDRMVVVPLQNANFVLKAGSADTRVDAEMT